MKSGLILILAAILFLATSKIVEYPDFIEGSGSIDASRWPAYKLRWNQDSPYLSKFSVRSSTVKKVSKEDQRYQILLTTLPWFTKTRASFRVNSYGGKEQGLFFGVINENRFSQKESQGVYDDTCALYTTLTGRHGNIYMNGRELEGWSEDWFVPEGSIIDVETDLSTGYVTFYNRDTGASKRVALPNSFYGVNVYLFVNAYHPNASFDLL